MTDTLMLRNARRYGSSDLIDVHIADGRIARIEPGGGSAPSGSTAGSGEEIDVEGRYVGPGLWDNHVHFTQWVIQSKRIDLSRTESAEDVLDEVRAARLRGAPLVDGVLVGYGFRDGLWPRPASLAALDAAESEIPVILVSGDLHCAWMNSLAAARLGVLGELDETGILAEMPWFTAQRRFDEAASLTDADFASVAATAAARGIVGIVDFEIADNIADWPARAARGVTALRVEASVWPHALEAAIAAGHRTGAPLTDDGLVRMGRLKIVVDGSLNTRTAWCWDPYPGLDASHPHACGTESVSIDELRRLLARAREGGIEVAVHAIGDRANTAVLDAYAELGMKGTVEHAQLVREEDFARFAELGLAASVQPEHAMDDRDVADRYWAGRTGRSFAYGSLLRSGAELRMGSDAPVAPLDPWIAISAGVTRSRGGRDVWHPEQRLPIEAALTASARSGFAEGEPADLVVLERDPLSCDEGELRDMRVAATLLGGRFTHRAL